MQQKIYFLNVERQINYVIYIL